MLPPTSYHKSTNKGVEDIGSTSSSTNYYHPVKPTNRTVMQSYLRVHKSNPSYWRIMKHSTDLQLFHDKSQNATIELYIPTNHVFNYLL